MGRYLVPLDTWGDRDRNLVLREIARTIIKDSFTFDPGSVGANGSLTTVLTASSYPSLKGLRPGMVIVVTPPSDLDDGLFVSQAFVGSDDSLTIKLRNATGSPINQGSGTWGYVGVMI